MPRTDEFDFFDLDKYALDNEWMNQPKLYFKYALKLADAREAFERAKAERDVVEAELDKDIRLHPQNYDMAKVREASVQQTILLQVQYKEANNDVIVAKHEVDVLQAVIDALDHRKRALENLVSLHAAQYFSEPRAKGVGREVADNMTKKKIRRSGMR